MLVKSMHARCKVLPLNTKSQLMEIFSFNFFKINIVYSRPHSRQTQFCQKGTVGNEKAGMLADGLGAEPLSTEGPRVHGRRCVVGRSVAWGHPAMWDCRRKHGLGAGMSSPQCLFWDSLILSDLSFIMGSLHSLTTHISPFLYELYPLGTVANGLDGAIATRQEGGLGKDFWKWFGHCLIWDEEGCNPRRETSPN